jgi:2-keto-3-deoxy-L-rhamnonate aldolase RhmA
VPSEHGAEDQCRQAATSGRPNRSRYHRVYLKIALVEDAATLINFDAFAALDGIAAYFVGPSDLSIALGVAGGSFDDKTLRL